MAFHDVRKTGGTGSGATKTIGQPAGHVAADITKSVPTNPGSGVYAGEAVSDKHGSPSQRLG